MRVKDRERHRISYLARGGHRDPKTIFLKRHKTGTHCLPMATSRYHTRTQSCFGGCTPPKARANGWMTSRYAGINMISPSEYHPMPLTTSLLHFLLLRRQQRAGKKATRARKARPATLGTCLEDMPSVVKVVKGTLRCVNGTAPPPLGPFAACFLSSFSFHASTRSHHQCMSTRPCLHACIRAHKLQRVLFSPPFLPFPPSIFQVRVVEARDISPPGCLTPEEPIDVSIYINFAGQEEVNARRKGEGAGRGAGDGPPPRQGGREGGRK